MAWEWHNASHLYRATILPGKAGAIVLLLVRVLALLLFAFGLLYSAFAHRVGVESLNPKYFTCAPPPVLCSATLTCNECQRICVHMHPECGYLMRSTSFHSSSLTAWRARSFHKLDIHRFWPLRLLRHYCVRAWTHQHAPADHERGARAL